MDFVSPIIGPIVESLLVPVKKHLGFWVSSTKYVKDMKKKMDQLEYTAKEVQDERDKAVVLTELVPASAEKWLEDVNNLNKRSNLLIEIGCFNVAKRYKVGKQAYDILEEMKDLENQGSKIRFHHTQKPLAEVGSSSTGPSTSAVVPYVGTRNNFKSRDLVYKAALKSLQPNNESQTMIALCGMGGIGKTTMMEQLKKEVEEKFDWVLKVVIGENTNPISLQQAIAEYIGFSFTETTINARADRLRKIFEEKSQNGQKKILVIMDDLWKEVDLKFFGLSPLLNGFKLLFTSRFENVCTEMGVRVDSIFSVGVLSDTEAKALFYRTVGPCPSDVDDDELQSIADDIVMKCGGLPIAIVTIAKTLSGNIKEAWQKALRRLEREDLTDLKTVTHSIFEMSYENLKEDDDKAIFLLCGLFPDDFNICTEDLLRYGWGLRLFKDANDLATTRSHMKICVNNLIRANLLSESVVDGCVKMHDLVRAFVLSNFSKVKQASIVNNDNMSQDRLTKDSYERILLSGTGMSGFHTDFNYQDLSFLMLVDGCGLFNFPEDMHKIMEKVEVVSYENMGIIPIPPIIFQHSTRLRTLCLWSCSLTGDISFLGSLCNLETLSLVECNITRLPSAIGKLKKLKLLDLTGSVDLHIDDGVLQDLGGSLQELYMRASKGRPVKFTLANGHELEKLSQRLFALELEFIMNEPQLKNVSFKNLKRFRLSIGCELKNYEKNSFRNSLNLVADCNLLKESNIGHLFKETEELRLQVKYMIHLEDVSLHHTFSQLRFLHISECTELTYLFSVDVANGLKKLERLTISNCPVLEALIGENNGIRLVTLKNLKFMSLEGLPKMVSLWVNVIEFPEMVELRLDGLPNFTSIYPDSNSNTSSSSMRTLFNKEGVIPKLEKLDISMMENLKQIWPCSEKNDVSVLRQIRVSACKHLINLFPRNPLPLLEHLEEVVVKKCDSVEVLFNIDLKSTGKHNSSRLRSIEVDELGKLKELWRIRGINKLDIVVIDSFKGVEEIIVENCKRFRDIFTPTTTNFDLGALTKYVSRYNSGDLDEWERENKMVEIEEEINATYPSYLLNTSHHLRFLSLRNDERVEEVVFDMDSSQLATIQVLLPGLESIELVSLRKMSHVWKCNNWNKFLIPQHHQPFQNLTDISLSFCPKINYLFSPLMAKYLSKLKSVGIYDCHGIEEVISSRDDEENTASTSSHQNTTFFPHFETLKLREMQSLRRVDDCEKNHLQSAEVSGSYWSLCQYPRSIKIWTCNALSSLIPWYGVGEMKRLQELEIGECKMLKEVFETNNNSSNDDDKGDAHATSLTPTNITTILVVPQLSSLKSVHIFDCDLLTHIFTFSTLKTLNHLKVLRVKECKAIQVIVQEENKTSSENQVTVFPHLEKLELDRLPNVKGFFMGKHDFQCPSLVNVMINDCPRWLMFTSGELKTPKLKNVHTSLGIYSLERDFNFQTTFPTSEDPTISKGMPSSFHDLIEINILKREVGSSIIPSNALLQMENLQQITIRLCPNLQEVFEVVGLEGTNKSKSVVKFPNLTQVNLEFVYDLKYLWKSNQFMILEFPNLTTVSIHYCNRLEHVFTCSMVASLVKLQDLRISNCGMIKVIVKVEEEVEYDANVNEVMLPCLNSLELYDLPSLEGFCLGKDAFSFPALDTLQIIDCPTITVFTKGHVSTPELNEIDTSFGTRNVRTDVNSFIDIKKEEGQQF